MFLSAGTAMPLSAQTDISREYQVKAAFLFNFAHFITWPADTFANPNSPFVIGVLGNDPFGEFLDDTVRGEKIDQHPLVIRRLQTIDEAKACQILFVSHSEEKHVATILDRVRGAPVLTVSDVKDFCEKGGTIDFVTTAQNKVHFRINLAASKDSGLTISSKLLRLADIVEAKNNPK